MNSDRTRSQDKFDRLDDLENIAHHSDEFDRREVAGGHGGVAGRAAQQARILRSWSLDGVECRGADD